LSDATKHLSVLLVDDDPDIHYLVDQYLEEREDIFSLTGVHSLTGAFEIVRRKMPDVVILDLSLPESRGLSTLENFRKQVLDVPVVVLTSLDDESAALEAVQKGAQDYLVKGHVTSRMLIQVLRYAVERHRTIGQTQQQFVDPVTGLYNRQGFFVFADRHLHAHARSPNGNVVYLLAVEQVKQIVREHGISEANHALKTTAEILKESFRSADIIARVGDDRFAVLPTTSSPFLSQTVVARIRNSQTYYNARFNLYKISFHWKPLHLNSSTVPTPETLAAMMDDAFAQYATRPVKTSSTPDELIEF
jgi:diguanylate cyclase (GGDEF)-like protein